LEEKARVAHIQAENDAREKAAKFAAEKLAREKQAATDSPSGGRSQKKTGSCSLIS